MTNDEFYDIIMTILVVIFVVFLCCLLLLFTEKDESRDRDFQYAYASLNKSANSSEAIPNANETFV